jgi:uncharacterized membrane protein YgcG
MTDLLSDLRRSPVAGDRDVAALLHSLRPAAGSSPRASEPLAAFIAEHGSGLALAAEPSARQVPDPDLLVVLGGAPAPRSSRRPRALTGGWATAAVAAVVALLAVAVASSGPTHDEVVRPTDASTTIASATALPTDQADPTPQRRHPGVLGAESRPHRARPHPAARNTSDRTAQVLPTAAATGDDERVRETEDTAPAEERGDDSVDESGSSTDDVGGATPDDSAVTDGGESSGGGATGGETPDAADD